MGGVSHGSCRDGIGFRVLCHCIALLPESSRVLEVCGSAMSEPGGEGSWFVASLGGAAGAADAAKKAGAG